MEELKLKHQIINLEGSGPVSVYVQGNLDRCRHQVLGSISLQCFLLFIPYAWLGLTQLSTILLILEKEGGLN